MWKFNVLRIMQQTLLQQIDFYILESQDYLSFACRLLEKAYLEKQHVSVLTKDASRAQALDQLLWTFRDTSFIPHHLNDDPHASSAPISIGHELHTQSVKHHFDILILLSPTLPFHYDHFPRLIVVVPQEDNWKKEARKHYKTLTDAGYQINTHKIKEKA